ncbi:MAG: pyridine nucleotide-disulfide oxidoreductase [Flavobacteriales bacterium]|nr:MAG: pyridine nucleotide-disulfide oxidoreductase [Flavobacteriales bacterium]
MNSEKTKVLIIGAGPAGCVSAAYLHQKGNDVIVIEKSKFPRFVIGESLLPISMEHFTEVGLFDCLDKQGFEKKHGARFMRDGVVSLFDFSKKFTPGWDWTWQVPRADFDQTLTEELINKGIDVRFEQEVTDISFNGTHSVTSIRTKTGENYTIDAEFVIDSSGYGRVLPRLLNLDKPSALPEHSSIFTHIKDTKRPVGKEGTLITFDIVKSQVWLWVIPFSNGTTSIGFVGPTKFIESYEGTTEEKLRALLKLSDYYYDRLKDEAFLFEPILINNYSKSVKQLYGDGYVLTGNSSEFLDPVFSSGVAFATASGLLAAKLADKQLNGTAVNWQKEYTNPINKGVAVFTSYIKDWYNEDLQTLFFHRPENLEVKEKICAVLAGYVWDESNPFVKKHDRAISSLAHIINMEEAKKANP